MVELLVTSQVIEMIQRGVDEKENKNKNKCVNNENDG